MSINKRIVALDIGERRIGVAFANSSVLIASPHSTVMVNGKELQQIQSIIDELSADAIIVGFPRNQQGEETAQTQLVKQFADRLKGLNVEIVFQDESLTSVLAEERLQAHNKPYTKADIDANAAAIILNDYMETHHARGI